MSTPTFLVTGAHGFIGAWVVKKLLAQNVKVVIFDQSADPQRLRLIMDDDEIARAQFVAGDITDEATVIGLVHNHGITNIIHLAGVQVPVCRANPRLGAMVNVVGTLNIFEAARQSSGQVKRIAYASSAAVFGEAEEGHAAKEDEAGKMATHYGAFKRCNEDNARVYFLDHGLHSVGLRPLTVYGAGRDFGITSGPTKAMKAAVVGRPYHIGFGGKTDFLYAGDCAEGFIRAATTELAGAHVFNIAGETEAVADVITEIEKLIPAAKGTLTCAPNPIPMPSKLDDTAIRAALQLPPATSLAAGVRETIERFQLLQREDRLDTKDLDS
ncbi:MAG: NAD-dependent epimerase/dehydratase family protein [Acidobacteria bacterium]|nr:NAD-dependent epimerase/dehydratase family protein [Acidobacteriota bacterium]MBI3422568.1 NAD-dependent epimerase/dehydratase family protein [Acidobacteriota bacterium]